MALRVNKLPPPSSSTTRPTCRSSRRRSSAGLTTTRFRRHGAEESSSSAKTPSTNCRRFCVTGTRRSGRNCPGHGQGSLHGARRRTQAHGTGHAGPGRFRRCRSSSWRATSTASSTPTSTRSSFVKSHLRPGVPWPRGLRRRQRHHQARVLPLCSGASRSAALAGCVLHDGQLGTGLWLAAWRSSRRTASSARGLLVCRMSSSPTSRPCAMHRSSTAWVASATCAPCSRPLPTGTWVSTSG